MNSAIIKKNAQRFIVDKTMAKKDYTKASHRRIALFFICVFMQSLVPHNQLWANNNGPNAPEAAAFEPIDATDMVNLVTGDFSYVLPLLNVPSPEGGYPIALSYHAGIAMDQEASWVGLGWSLNPGAINRSVNGFPDDYYQTEFNEFFYDRGGSETNYNLSVGYGSPDGNLSVGLGFSWGTNRALGGSVSLGFGPESSGITPNARVTLGTDGNASIGAGVDLKGGLSFGISASNKGTLGINAGYSNNEAGVSVSASSDGTYGVGFSAASGKNTSVGLNLSYSKSGIGITAAVSKRKDGKVVSGGGTGIQLSFDNGVDYGDYTVKQSGYTIPLIAPTPKGVFSLSFSKQKITWFLNKTEKNSVTGPLNFNKEMKNTYCVKCTKVFSFGTRKPVFVKDLDNLQDAENLIRAKMQQDPLLICRLNLKVETFMDVNEFPLNHQYYTSLDKNNVIFPNIDSYTVQAQGISGNLSLKHYENASLFSLSKEHPLFNTAYNINGKTQATSDKEFTFENKPEFYFESEFTSYLATQKATFNYNSSNANILDYHQSSDQTGISKRRKTANYIEYFTYKDLKQLSDSELFTRGYVKPSNWNKISTIPDNAIAAFTVVNADGKRYHYSLPVYNHASLTRMTGTVSGKSENDAYYEKIQDTPYATHWLLTAITGSDYVDVNGNGKVNEGDYGYWIEFDYGKWSEAYAWKIPYGKEAITSEENESLKTRIEGFKDVYYLDQIKTRTHTAIFSKSPRRDNLGAEWRYKTVKWNDANSGFDQKFYIPRQKSLKLEKIILLKNEDAAQLSKSTGDYPNTNPGVVSVLFPRPNAQQKSYSYQLENSVFDSFDIPSQTLNKAIKVINLNYEEPRGSLAINSPNTSTNGTGRLTLKSVNFIKHVNVRGQSNKLLIPPYKFEYYNPIGFNLDNKNDWGYHDETPWNWSLKTITTPEGGKVNVTYESDDFHKPSIQAGKLFTRQLRFSFLSYPPYIEDQGPVNAPEGRIRIKIETDPNDPLAQNLKFSDYFETGATFFMDMWFSATRNWKGRGYARRNVDIKEEQATIVEMNTSENYMIVEVLASSPYVHEHLRDDVNPVSAIYGGKVYTQLGMKRWLYGANQNKPRYDLAWKDDGQGNGYSLNFKVIGNKKVYDQKEGDIRVKELAITDDINTYTTKYKYNQEGFNDDPTHNQYRSSGVVSYIPNTKNVPIPFAAELPAPKVMYEKVAVINTDKKGVETDKSLYTFNVLKEKSSNAIKFGDLFEITSNETKRFNSGQEKEVSIRETTVHDNLSAIGQLLELKKYNAKGQLISSSKNEYFGKHNRPNKHGIDQESFQSYKEVYYNDAFKDKWLIGSSSRVNYAQALKRTTSVSNGQSRVTDYTSYNPITGAVIETTSTLSDNTIVKSKNIPAYSVYPEMGSKVDDINNRNMLSQSAANLTQIKKGEDWKTIGADITTWNSFWNYSKPDGTIESATTPKVWRKHKNFAWKGEVDSTGVYLGYSGDFDNFNFHEDFNQPNDKWINTSTVNLYDHFSMPLETEDINGNSIATKMGDRDSKIIATCNSKYTEMFYSGAEYSRVINGITYLDGEIKTNGSIVNIDKAHTGNHIIRASNTEAFEVTFPIDSNRKVQESYYKVSVWVRKGQENNLTIVRKVGNHFPFVQEFEPSETITAGDWVQLSGYIDIPTEETTLQIYTNGTSDLDDFRILPIESNMTSYVYNKRDELSYIIGVNNLATKYEYDDAGRLKKTYTEVIDDTGVIGGFKLQKEINYHYKYVPTDQDLDPDKIYLSLGINDPYASNTVLTATAIGGSSQFKYSFKFANSASQLSNSPGEWGASNTATFSTSCTGPWMFYRVWALDTVTERIVMNIGSHRRLCHDDDNDGNPISQPNNQTGNGTGTGPIRDGQPIDNNPMDEQP